MYKLLLPKLLKSCDFELYVVPIFGTSHKDIGVTDDSFFFFQTKNPTIIEHDNHEYIFEGFSLFSHYKLENVSTLYQYIEIRFRIYVMTCFKFNY